MNEDRNAKMLERVRALLAKADSTNFPEEAETFRAKADELMTAYAIEQWQVDQAQDGVTARPKPEARYVDINWWWGHSRGDELWGLFTACARHCRCVVAYRGQGSGPGGYSQMPLIGLPSDLDYFDLMFTSLMLQMGRELERQPTADKTLAENVYDMRMAGMNWERITKLLWEAGMVKPSRGEHMSRDGETIEAATPFDRLPEAYWKVIKNRLAQLNRKHARDNGLERNYVHPGVFQRSYAMGFVSEVRKRMRQLRARAEGTGDNPAALALRDIRQVADDMYQEMFPPPEDDGKKSKGGGAVSRELATDMSAYYAGSAAGARADLGTSPSRRVGARREIERG